ncbi:hypothetical protein M408DRAFT_27956 [Serendipita vermifera MAFF 305830]|uniref:Mediator of RNA polymerase II transcription subunit 14 n=1 Tax=Serendipita vermifera MAFF 305830 TaxID=933852 RepID=A0A0C2WAC1_SERVB|nr:hypothetical protein M408DRAFT_27956 [Serendipita vermifera MAFF 305830]
MDEQHDIKPSYSALNGTRIGSNGSPQLGHEPRLSHSDINGTLGQEDERPLPSLEELERELPVIEDGQVFLGLVMHQLVQDLYAQLLNVAETIGRAPDSVKKAKLQAWLSQAYKQTSKLYVLTKYSRNAADIQKAMNVAAFLRTQGEQIIWATKAIHTVQDEAHRQRIRNPDLLTALDVLTTGTYTRLPTRYTTEFVPRPKMSDKEVANVFGQVEDLMRMRLLCKDVVPVEMRKWRIEGGRTFFTVPKRFETSLIMTGAQKDDVWAFVHVEFLFGLPTGERKGAKEFPKRPPKALSDDLAFQVRDIISDPNLALQSIPSGPLTSAVVDAPLVRVYNFLQLLSLTYQLEILIYQADRLHEFGWKDSLRLRIAPDRKSMTVQYWVRPPIPKPTLPGQLQNMPGYHQTSALSAGEITIAIVPVNASSTTSTAQQPPSQLQPGRPSQQSSIQPESKGPTSSRTPIDRIKAQMQERLKLRGGGRPSDEVEQHRFEVTWKPLPGALGVMLAPLELDTTGLEVDPDCLDFEGLLKKVLRRHADAIMAKHLENARTSNMMQMFPHPDDVRYVEHHGGTAMRVQLAGEQHIIITIELQTGKFLIHESGDLGAALRGVRWRLVQTRINQDPAILLDLCALARYGAILDLVESRASLLGITTYRHRHLVPSSMAKFGKNYGLLFCQLAMFPRHYVAILIVEGGFKYALVEINEQDADFGGGIGDCCITDFGWVHAEKFLNLGEIEDEEDEDEDEADDAMEMSDHEESGTSRKRKRSITDVGVKLSSNTPIPTPKDPFDITIRELRDLHAYCRARVAHIHIENQLKTRNIPYIHVRANKLLPPQSRSLLQPNGSSSKQRASNTINDGIQKSPFLPYLPILCVQSKDLLAGAAAAEAAMPNIRIEPTEWWTLDKECMVTTSVRLKYVQPLDGPGSKGGPKNPNGESGATISPSENISYDPRSSVVTFLSRKVGDCVDEFLTEWARVSKVVVIARQVSLMPSAKRWKDVKILSFDLQTVKFAYYQDYAVSVTSVEGNYQLSFFRCSPAGSNMVKANDSPSRGTSMDVDASPSHTQATRQGQSTQRNAHEDTARFAQELLKDERLGTSVFEMVGFLRSTVGIVEALDLIESGAVVSSNSTGTPGKAKVHSCQFDVLVKAAGWWRIQYSAAPIFTVATGKRHALDVRFINGRVMIVDGSVDLHARGFNVIKSAGLLAPLPRIEELVKAVLDVEKNHGPDSDGIIPVNYGDAVICGSGSAPRILRGLHEKIMDEL